MPAKVWVKWLTFWSQEPFGPRQRDLRAGVIGSMIVNAQRTKKSDPVTMPDDLFPKLKEEQEQEGVKSKLLTPDQQWVKVFWINAMMGGKFVDKRRKRTMP